MLHYCISFNEGTSETCLPPTNGSTVIKMSHLLTFTAAVVISFMLLL